MPRKKGHEVPAVAAGTLGRNKVKQSIKIELPTEEKAEIAREIARKENRAYGNWVSWLIIQAVEESWDDEQREVMSIWNLTSDDFKENITDMAKRAGVDVYTLFKDQLKCAIEQLESGELTIGYTEEDSA